MAQTRAVSRALRAPLGQIVALAGYAAASAEEMPLPADEPATTTGKPADPVAASDSQLEEISTLIRTLQGADPDTDWKTRAKDLAGVPAGMLTKTSAAMLIEKLQAEFVALTSDDGEGE